MIKLSKKWSYAIKAMIYIWKNNTELKKVSDISNDWKIPEALLRRIIADLDKKGIIETIKWRNGWVRLWKKICEISIYDILDSVWEELWVSDCTKWILCDKHDSCMTTDFYMTLQKWMNWVLKLYTLDKIIK